jgi:hypothetical protein
MEELPITLPVPTQITQHRKVRAYTCAVARFETSVVVFGRFKAIRLFELTITASYLSRLRKSTES